MQEFDAHEAKMSYLQADLYPEAKKAKSIHSKQGYKTNNAFAEVKGITTEQVRSEYGGLMKSAKEKLQDSFTSSSNGLGKKQNQLIPKKDDINDMRPYNKK
jgi:hypothetical protein